MCDITVHDVEKCFESLEMTERINIENLIMQGTVFGSIICSTVMENLTNIFCQDKDLIYMYKGVVKVPVLGMVDNVLIWQNAQNKHCYLTPLLTHSWSTTNWQQGNVVECMLEEGRPVSCT